MKERLPLGRPPILSYLFHMYPLAVLAQGEAYLPWLYGTHIQLFNFPGEELKFFVHPFSTRHQLRYVYHPACPLLDVQMMDRQVLETWSGGCSAKFVELIKNGYYPQVDLDFFYLAERREFQRRHFLHELLLFGFDEEEGIFDVLGFDRQGRFAVSAVRFVELEQALSTPREQFMEEACRRGEPPLWFGEAMSDRPRFFLYRYMGDEDCPFDPLSVVLQLDDYLNGRDSAERLRTIATPRPGGVWGMAVYGFLRDLLSTLRHAPETYSPIPLRLLWEHKRCMRERLEFMENRGCLERSSELASRYGEVERMAGHLKLILLRWAGSGRPKALEEAQNLLGDMAALEFGLLSRVRDRLLEVV